MCICCFLSVPQQLLIFLAVGECEITWSLWITMEKVNDSI